MGYRPAQQVAITPASVRHDTGCNGRGRYHVPHVDISQSAEASVQRQASNRRSKRRAHPADAAQARLFTEILRNELVEIEVTSAELELRCQTGADEAVVKELLQLSDRAKEVRQLLDTLRDRFAGL